VRIIEQTAEGWLRAAVVLMSQAGLRVGALPSLSINGTRWTATTKGKEQSGLVPQEAREAIQRAGLSLRSPFQAWTTHKIEDALRAITRKLHDAGTIKAEYSCHDLRHAYAVRIYQTTHDVYQVKQALGHATVGVTETYLRSIGVTP
jgi:integrase